MKLTVYRSEYGTGREGFLNALSDGATYDLEIEGLKRSDVPKLLKLADTITDCLGSEKVEIGLMLQLTETKFVYKCLTEYLTKDKAK